MSRGNGGRYAYYFCLGRHHGRTSCDLPHLNPEEVERAVLDHYTVDQLAPDDIEGLRGLVLEDLAQAATRTDSERRRLTARMTSLRHTRYQWAEKAIAGAVPDDIAREKQRQLGVQLAQAESDLARIDQITVEIRADVNRIFDLAREAARSYRESPDDIRREWNFSRYDALEIDVEDWHPMVAVAHRTPIFEAIRTAKVDRPTKHRGSTRPGRSRTGPVMALVDGSTVPLLVEVTTRLSNQDRRSRIRQLHAVVLEQCPHGVVEENTVQLTAQHSNRQVQHRLSPEQVARLVADYQAGVSINDLVSHYRVDQSTVTQHVKRAGVRLRYPVLLPEGADEAAKLYRSGLSLAAIGAHFGIDASTVRRALLRAGVKMRDCQGRKR